MSRLIVKNLPTYLTPDRLRKHFEQKGAPAGTITDVKVSFKPDGTSRRFGFVGFKSEAEALRAKEWFNRTYVDSTRITVDVVDVRFSPLSLSAAVIVTLGWQGTKDAPAPRPNKRRRLDPTPEDENAPSKANGGKVDKKKKANVAAGKEAEAGTENSQLAEYMTLMKPKKGPAWANDAEVSHPAAPVPSSSTTAKATSEQSKDSADANDPPDEEMAEPSPHVPDGDEAISDMEWMRRRMAAASTLSQPAEDAREEKAFYQSEDEDDNTRQDSTKATPEPEAEKDPAKETILETSRLFLRNLTFSCTEEEIREHFQPFGNISQVHIPLDSSTRKPKGVAYVTFSEGASALSAYESLDKKSFQGRVLHILPAVDRIPKPEQPGDDKKRSVKDQKAAQRKVTAGREFNWSMLYMNSDAVMSSVADRMNVSKADMLDPESSNAAVKMALAETHVIQETKAFLEQQGVVLSTFDDDSSGSGSKRVRRSDTTILVKNIPYGTSEAQIREMFEPHGQLARAIVPPAGTIAVVEFLHADEAGKAFKAVAYRRLGNSVVYLEKGPLGMLRDPDDVPSSSAPATASLAISRGEAAKPVTIDDQEAGAGAGDEPALSAGSTLFVKNLSFATTNTRLSQACGALPGFAFARVQTKPDPKRPSDPTARLSMGYGFVGFKTPEHARGALKSVQGLVLDGHALSVKFAGRGQEEVGQEGKGASSKGRTTKMIVKNVPFEASKKDIRELFGAHGQLKSVRLPKKFDSRSRGFAFLEFLTRQEAENAYAALRHTHLLGRHLVLQWAEEDGATDVDALRAKAGVGFGGGAELPWKKRKVRIGDDDAGEDGVDM
ncbi:RNA-binding domain-containing protein [Coniophora puteana RWD-64-598 SS2]|uniref:Multiple RNA-binding domain-containing protein 1 n=1 Tax=Coniophora puteana (strain RWD-64-598) TaxID=741705 RepID=A0A5M3M825_CONPW|nr:RNA-binding domain-containing protein [Coniophora puteana RWD-64-598 SS2]EIW74821.1 RNA-binding domain-containing protein [Coniophora puteana RWD-64-598 SS2]